MNFLFFKKKENIINILLIILSLLIVYFLTVLVIDNKDKKNELNQKNEKIILLEKENNSLLGLKKELEEENTSKDVSIEDWKLKYEEKKDSLDLIEDSFGDLVKSVTKIEKIQSVDKELLSKYSSEYFLNEHYVPSRLTNVDDKYLYNEDKSLKIDKGILNYFEDMVDDAQSDDINLKIISVYRSFEYQKNIKERYVEIYGQENADSFSANEGLSEHQLGTAIDFVAKNGLLDDFDGSEEFK